MLIGLTYDLRSEYLAQGYSVDDVAEFDSDHTIDAIENTIRKLGHRTDRIGNAKSLCSRLVTGDRWDLVFNIAEGLYGRSRESQVPAILELYDIPYTLSDPLVCAITLDKALSKKLIQAAKLPTPAFAVIEKMNNLDKINLNYPLFVKPIAEGTGKGIDNHSMVNNLKELENLCDNLLKNFRQPVIVEEFLPGREFTVGILGNGDNAWVLGGLEIVIPESPKDAVYSYIIKEQCEHRVKYLPMDKTEPFYADVERLALQCCLVLECRDAARVDFRFDAKGVPNFLEINPLPGLHPTHSDLPMIATQEGMSYEDLIGNIINCAAERTGCKDNDNARQCIDSL
ncbi:MAG: ATP-grasp domain-containing protein [Sedimentisphaerales bacterium]|nr:ATP-grasp domain-containing protein [Sedimentisphaerales bacterium]